MTCEKDVGMGLCTFNFVLRLSLHLVCLLFGTSSLHLFEIFLLTCNEIHVGVWKCNQGGVYCTVLWRPEIRKSTAYTLITCGLTLEE